MKLSEVEVGGRYLAKVSGHLRIVRVVEVQDIPSAVWSRSGRRRTLISAVNEATGRTVTFRSAQKLRSKVGGGS